MGEALTLVAETYHNWHNKKRFIPLPELVKGTLPEPVEAMLLASTSLPSTGSANDVEANELHALPEPVEGSHTEGTPQEL